MKLGNIWHIFSLVFALILVISVSAMAVAQDEPLVSTVSGYYFQLDDSYTVTEIRSYHSYGAQPGWIKLEDQNGNIYGPWYPTLESGTYWIIRDNIYLNAGSYKYIDSDTSTYQGQAWIYGYMS